MDPNFQDILIGSLFGGLPPTHLFKREERSGVGFSRVAIYPLSCKGVHTEGFIFELQQVSDTFTVDRPARMLSESVNRSAEPGSTINEVAADLAQPSLGDDEFVLAGLVVKRRVVEKAQAALLCDLYEKIYLAFKLPVDKSYFNSFLCLEHIKTVYVFALACSNREVVVSWARHEREGASFKLIEGSRGVSESGSADE